MKKKQFVAMMMSLVMAFSTPLSAMAVEDVSAVQEEVGQSALSKEAQEELTEDAQEDPAADEPVEEPEQGEQQETPENEETISDAGNTETESAESEDSKEEADESYSGFTEKESIADESEEDVSGSEDKSEGESEDASEGLTSQEYDSIDQETQAIEELVPELAVETEAVDDATVEEGEIVPQTLTADMTIQGDAKILKSGNIYLNGHTLKVTGNLLQSSGAIVVGGGSLEVGGDYRIQSRSSNGTYSSSTGVLAMTDEADSVKVGGDFYASGNSGYYDEAGKYISDNLSAGVLEIGGNFYKTMNGSFYAKGTHKVLLTGSGGRTISVNGSGCCFNNLEVGQGIDLTWSGYLNVSKMESDLDVTPAEEEGISLYRSGNGDVMDFNGHSLTVMGNIKETEGTFKTGGKPITVEGNISKSEGYFYLGGGSMKVTGDLQQGGGSIVLAGGTLEIGGDYRIQSRSSNGTYSSSTGVLAMTDEADSVKVGGDFYASGNSGYYDEAGKYISDNLSAGVLEIGGNFYKTMNGSFYAKGTHKVLLTGSGGRTISVNGSGCCFNNLEVGQGIDLTWSGYLNVSKMESDLDVTPAEEEGISLYRSGNGDVMDFNGHSLTVMGNIKETEGTFKTGGKPITVEGNISKSEGYFYLGGGSMEVTGDLQQGGGSIVLAGGTLEIGGDYRIQSRSSNGTYSSSTGVLAMTDEADSVKVGGDFYASGNSGYYDEAGKYISDNLSAGVLEIGGNFYKTMNGSFYAKGTHKVLLTGSGGRTISVNGSGCCFNNLEVGQGIDLTWSGYLNVSKMESDLDVTPAEEEGISLYRSGNGDVMDFNGHSLTVMGNIKETEGTFKTGGKPITVEGNISKSEGYFYLGGGSMEVTGDLQQGGGSIVLAGGTLEIGGDYRIQSRSSNGTYSSSTGVLAMTDEADSVKVGGDFYASGNSGYYDEAGKYISDNLSAGVLEIGGNFYKTMNGSFYAKGTHKVLLTGSGGRTISVNGSGCCFNNLEVGQGIDLTWSGYLNVSKMESDLDVTPAEEEGISLYRSGNGDVMDFNGHSLTVMGNIKETEGTFKTGGKPITVEGNISKSEGYFYLGGGSMKVTGDLQQGGGSIVLAGGTLEIGGDYRIQSRSSNGTYSSSTGVLAMTDEADSVKVGGDFYASGNSGYYDEAGKYISDNLSAGVLEIGGNFYKTMNGSFYAKGTHKVLLTGSGGRTISVNGSGCCFNNLEVGQGIDLTWSGYLNVSKMESDLDVTPAEEEGISLYRSGNGDVMDFNGHSLTVMGNIKETEGTFKTGGKPITVEGNISKSEGYFYLGGGSMKVTGDLQQGGGSIVLAGGTLEIGGDYRIQSRSSNGTYSSSTGVLAMTDEADSVKVGGDFYASGNSGYYDEAGKYISDNLSAGVLEIGGNFYQTMNGSFYAKGTHKVIMSGTGQKTICFESAGSAFHELDLKQAPDKYLISRVPCWDVLKLNGTVTTENPFEYAGKVNEEEKTLIITQCLINSSQITIPEMINGYSVAGIGKRAFKERDTLEKVTIPKGVTVIEDEAFYGCANLDEVVFTGGSELVSIGKEAFSGCKSLSTVEIPDGVTKIGSYAFYNCGKMEMVIIPDSVTSIESSAFSKTEKLVLYVGQGSYAEQFAIDNKIAYEYFANMGHSVSLHVENSRGEDITKGFTVSWYSSDGALLGTNIKIRNVTEGAEYRYSIALGEELSYLYDQPADTVFKAGSQDETIEVVLSDISKIRISGTVKGAEGERITNAQVKLKQIYGGGFERTVSTESNESGEFSLDANKTKSIITITAEGYYNGYFSMPKDYHGDEATIDAVLQKMPSNKITLTMFSRFAVETGEETSTEKITNANGLGILAYNETRKSEVTDLKFQYPYITLGENDLSEGDVIRLSLRDENGIFTAEDIRVKLDGTLCADAEWTLVENGRIRLTNITGNEEEIVMLFNDRNSCVESGNATSAYTSGPLPEGQYTCAVIKKTTLLRSIDSFSRLAEMGLVKSKDYAVCKVTVKKGVISVLSDITVPVLDESKLYYTINDNTHLWTNYSKVTTGQYVTIRAAYEIEDKHSSASETVIFEIPDGMTLVEGSLTVNGKAGTCMIDNSTVSVPVNAKKGTIRFYLLPVNAGMKTVHAFLSFVGGNSKILQPIGTTEINVSAASISVPEKTGFRTVVASGKAIANCDITVYDNGTPVGNTVSKKNGSWSLEFELVNPLKYSYHEIYAAVRNNDYDVNIETDVAELLYNSNYVELSKVTMINTAHPNDSLVPTEFSTVFDFLHPDTAVPTYNYWPSYPKFTFIAEFTGGDADTLSDVYIVSTNSSGNETLVPCEYDETDRIWIGTHNYTSFSDVPCSLTVVCDNKSSQKIDTQMEFKDFAGLLIDNYRVKSSLTASLEETAELQNEEISDNKYSTDIVIANGIVLKYEMETVDYELFDLSEWENDNYKMYEYDDGTVSYQSSHLYRDSYVVYTAYPDEELLLKETTSWKDALELTENEEQQTNSVRSWIAAFISSMFPGTGEEDAEKDPDTSGVSGGSDPSESYSVSPKAALSSDQAEALHDLAGMVDQFEVVDTVDEWGNIAQYGIIVKGDTEILKDKLAFYRRMLDKCKCMNNAGFEKGYKQFEEQVKQYEKDSKGLFVGGIVLGSMLTVSRAKNVIDKSESLHKKRLENYEENRKLYRAMQKKNGLSGRGRLKVAVKKDLQNKALGDAVFSEFINMEDIASNILDVPLDDDFMNDPEELTDLFCRIAQTDDSFEDFSDMIVFVTDQRNTDFLSIYDQIDGQIEVLIKRGCPCTENGGKCTCNENNPNTRTSSGGTKPEKRSAVPKADPSGYVYEAVPSNRVSGVQAQIYYYDYAIDDFGVPEDEKSEILWDAENYDQINPQITDVYGCFAWDVPEGQWLVKFTKEGYEDTDSHNDVASDSEGYLPVPPIQTEVNTAIVSKAAPEVQNVTAYQNEVDIDFSQYMQIDTVNTKNVIVKTGGTVVKGTIRALNAEYNYEGTKQYASSFAFVPSEKLSGSVSVAVSKVRNYNGKAIGVAYSKTHDVVIKPETIEITGGNTVEYHGDTVMEVRILPAEAGANQTITVTNYSPSIVAAASQTVTTDADGKVSITLSGKLPGEAVLSIALEGTKLSTEKQVVVTSGWEESVKSLEEGGYEVRILDKSIKYDGKEKKPAVSIEGLTEGVDFTVEYSNNVNAGTATVTVTGIGSYTGTLTGTFYILPGKTTRGDMFNLANNVKVTWKEVPGAAYYKVYREGVTDKKETRKEPVIVTTGLVGWDKDPGLTNGHAYRYKIVASLTGKGDPSGDSTLSYSKVMYRLKTVVIRSVKNTAPGKVTVKYDKTTSGDSYVLQYCERQDMVGAKTKVVLGANNTSYVIGGLKKGKAYYISIRVRKKVNGIDYYTTFGVPKKIKITQ